uniref:Uncharacterized protein n=1 Tax=Anguilla anguilla TaxID=7936 RepID=A0A0E9UFS9_ANGAN
MFRSDVMLKPHLNRCGINPSRSIYHHISLFVGQCWSIFCM